MTPATKARLRFAIVAAALVPFAIFAKLAQFGRLQTSIQRAFLSAWDRYERAVHVANST